MSIHCFYMCVYIIEAESKVYISFTYYALFTIVAGTLPVPLDLSVIENS